MVRSQNEPPHLFPCGCSPVSSSTPCWFDASSVCTKQLYSNGNKSDYQSKQMHGIKQKVYFAVVWSSFPKGTGCLLRAAFTNLSMSELGERRMSHDWVSCSQEKQLMAKPVSVAPVGHITEGREHRCFVIVSSWLFCHSLDRLPCCPPYS